MIFDMFKSKADKEQEKAEKEVSKLVKEVAAAEKMQEAVLKREAAEKARQAQADLDYKRQVRKAEASLKDMEDTVSASIALALNQLQNELAKPKPYENDLKKYRARVKNYFFEYVTIKRAQETLEDCKINHQWEQTMTRLSNTFKLMNQVKSRSSAVKKILFFYRYGQLKNTREAVYKQIEDYFGSEADDFLKDEKMKKFESMDPIDLMVSDELFEVLRDPSDLQSAYQNPNVNNEYADAAADKVVGVNQSAETVGAAPPVEGINKNNTMSEEEMENLSNMY